MAISASLVKDLRERTGLGMMECKKALAAADGDIELAIENLRKSSGMKAAKKAGRIAAEGIIIVKVADDGRYGVMSEVNSETDFAARDEGFLAFADKVNNEAFTSRNTDVEQLMVGELANAREALVQKIGENIGLRRVAELESDIVGSYVHSNNRIGVLVALKGGNVDLAKDIAMHIAASNPEFVSPEAVSEEKIEAEKAIFSAQAQDSGKPAEIIEKMVEGRIRKYLSEISLTEQPFVKDPDIKVGKLVKNAGAELVAFTRYEVGEGIEKDTKDFATEVAEQLKNA